MILLLAPGGQLECIRQFHQKLFIIGNRLKATQLWHTLAAYLKANVTRKRRRYKIKQYDDCFTGENAVDVIYDCLHREKKTCTLITNEITRTTAVKVCQTLLNNNIIEVVGAKTSQSANMNQSTFEDRNTKLYRFSTEEEGSKFDSTQGSCKSFENKDRDLSASPNIPQQTANEVGSTPPLEMSRSWFEHLSPFQSPYKIPNLDALEMNPDPGRSPLIEKIAKRFNPSNSAKEESWHIKSPKHGQVRPATRPKSEITVKKSIKASPSEFKENLVIVPPGSSSNSSRGTGDNDNALTFEKTTNGNPSLLKFQKRLLTSNPTLQSSFVEGDFSIPINEDSVWKQVALSRLLPLLDLPYIEDIVASPKRVCLQKSDYQSVIPNHMLLAKLEVTPKSENAWIRMAQEITESRCFFLDNPIGLTDSQLKIQAFEKIHRYYRNLPSSMIPTHLCKVFTAILRHIKEGRFTVAVRAFQLAVLLLPWQQRKELKQLFKFIQLASEDTTVKIKKQFTNRQYMLNEFTPLIIQHELLGHEQGVILVSFILHNSAVIFAPPLEIRQEVERVILDSRLTGAIIPTAINYCQQVSSSAFKEQANSFSKNALQELMNSVMDSFTMPLKDKEKWLKRFKKSHGDIYSKAYKGDI